MFTTFVWGFLIAYFLAVIVMNEMIEVDDEEAAPNTAIMVALQYPVIAVQIIYARLTGQFPDGKDE